MNGELGLIRNRIKKDVDFFFLQIIWVFRQAHPACLTDGNTPIQSRNNLFTTVTFCQSISALGINYPHGVLCHYHTILSGTNTERSAVHLLRSPLNPPSHDPPTISGLASRVSPPSVSVWSWHHHKSKLIQRPVERRGTGREGGWAAERSEKRLRRQWDRAEDDQWRMVRNAPSGLRIRQDIWAGREMTFTPFRRPSSSCDLDSPSVSCEACGVPCGTLGAQFMAAPAQLWIEENRFFLRLT